MVLSTAEKLASRNPTVRREGQAELSKQSPSQATKTATKAVEISQRGYAGTVELELVDKEAEKKVEQKPTEVMTKEGGVSTAFPESYQEQQVQVRERPSQFTRGMGTYTAAPEPQGFLEKARAKLRPSTQNENIVTQYGAGLGVSAIETGLFAKSLVTSPVKTTKEVGSGLAALGTKVVKREESLAPGLKAQVTGSQAPYFAGRVTGELLTLKGTSLALKGAGRAAEIGKVLASPKLKLVQTTTFGEKVVKGIKTTKGVLDLRLIPKGVSKVKGGAYGFTRAEQAQFIGKEVPVVTSARDLLGTIRKRKVTVAQGEGGLGIFATPGEIGLTPQEISGRARTRLSRLEGPPKAKLIDVLAGDFQFKLFEEKPQIVLFPREKIGKDFKPFGYPSSELEVTLPPGKIIKRVGKKGGIVIEGRGVPIIEAEIAEASPKVRELLKKDKLSTKELRVIEKETGFSSRKRKPTLRPGIRTPTRVTNPRLNAVIFDRKTTPRKTERLTTPKLPSRLTTPRITTPRLTTPVVPRVSPRVITPRVTGRVITPTLPKTVPRMLRLPQLQLQDKPIKTKQSLNKLTRFQPSIAGIELGVKAPLKKLEEQKLTGLEIRAIPI